MHFTSLAVAALAGVAQAIKVQVVDVGMNTVNNKTGLMFWPDKITAEPGSMVQFQFWALNHTVTQSNFDNPCVPISNINSSIQGFYSGYQPVDASAAQGMIPTYSVMINDTKPIWVFCSQATHCQSGMSMVINEDTTANATRSLDNYRKLAQSATASELLPNTDSSSNSGSGSGSNSSATTKASSGSATTASPVNVATTIATAVSQSNSTATAATGTASSTETAVTAAAVRFGIPSTALVAVGLAFFFL